MDNHHQAKQEGEASTHHGVLAWFARNHVAANLLMVAVVVVGLLVARTIRKEVYPSFSLDTVEISIAYRGASPEEVERAIVVPVESELRGMDLIRRVRSFSREGRAEIEIELVPGTDSNRGLQEITSAVQQVSVFPDETEPPRIRLDRGRRREVMRIALYGDLDERGLTAFARQIEQGLLADPVISLINFRGIRRPEITVEVPLARLRSLNLTLDDIARALSASALDVPAGTMRTPGGDILLKTTERRDFAREFERIPIVSTADGAQVTLSDIAKITDGFEDSQREAYFNGKRAMFLEVMSAENQSPVEVAVAVRAFIEREQKSLPASVGLTLARDRSDDYEERIQLLMHNGALGLILVLLALGLFLELRVAFWTAAGIPVSIIGALILLPSMDASINMISLFGFIVTLGIVVDDAVVVGEEIFHRVSLGTPRLQAAVEGVRAMSVPVTFAVATNIIAFMPLLFVPGETGRFFQILPAVVIAVFSVSLIECLLILPSHLSFGGGKQTQSLWGKFNAWQTRLRTKLDDLIDWLYLPVARFAIRWRYLVASVFVAGLLIVVAYLMGGHIEFAFRPSIQTDFVQAEIELPSGTSVDISRRTAFEIEAAAYRTLEKLGEKNILKGMYTTVAERGPNEAEVSVILVPSSNRKISSEEFANRWRDEIGEVPEAESIFFDYIYGPGGSAEVQIEIAHPEIETLQAAANDVAEAIKKYPGAEDVRKGFGRAMPQKNFELTPEARSMGITARELGRQIRSAFYGAEALRQPRGYDEVRVMVRLPDKDRATLAGLEDLIVRSPFGGEIPLAQAARIIEAEAPVRIERVDGGRVLDISANVIPGLGNGNKIISAFERDDIPRIAAKYPGLTFSFEGEQREQREAMTDLSWGLLAALFAIYAIMASLLRSYVQAVIVLLTIPWSLAGAVVGHALMGFNLSIFSVFGMIALCGMVVNGAFVLALTRNGYVRDGQSHTEATILAAQRRFRPIFLTAVTTFLGLAPMIFETSLQSLFLVPMAIALGVGTVVSAIVTLVLIPALMVIAEEIGFRV